MSLYSYPDLHSLNHALLKQLLTILRLAIDARGQAFIAVSGGKTPKTLFELLAKSYLDWPHVTIVLTDERCLSPTLPDSNEYLVKTYLLQHEAAQANFISLYSDKVCPVANSDEIESRLRSLPTFDVVLLGMGEDGHTASLFPGSAELAVGLADDSAHGAALRVTPLLAPYKRISLTKNRLLNSHHVFLVIVGEKKRKILEVALQGADPFRFPVSAFLHHPDVEVQIKYALD